MHYYIAQWVNASDSAGPVYQPPIDESGDWSVIDLRPDASIIDGYCLIASDHVHPATPGLWYLTDDLDANLSPPIKNYIENGLGITLAAPTLRGAIAEILLVHSRLDGSRWGPARKNPRTGLIEIYLRGLVYEAPEIVGASYTESFNTADSDTLGPDLSWTEVQGDWDVVSNRCQLAANGSPVSYARADSDTTGDDQYAKLSVVNVVGDGSNYTQFGVCGRFYNAGNSSYMMFIQEDDGVDEGYKLRKTVAGVRSDITSFTTTTLPAEPWTLMLTVVGTTLRGFIDGTNVATNTDPGGLSGSNYRRAGAYGYGGAGSSSPFIVWDALDYGDYSELDQTITPALVQQLATAFNPTVALSGGTPQYATPALAQQLAQAFGPTVAKSYSLTPNADGTISGFFNQVGATSGLYASIDDDPDSPTLTDWITAGEANGSAFIGTDDHPTDWEETVTAKAVAYLDSTDFDTDTAILYAQLFDADEVTSYSDEVQLGTQATSGLVTATFTLTAAGLAATRAEWDAHVVKIREAYTA